MAIPLGLQIGATGIGLLGTLLGGGRDERQVTEIMRQMSPEQRALLEQLQAELGQDGFDISGIVRSTRERLGAESSALRQSALQRLQRAGVSPLQQESVLADITTRGLRELGSTIANLEFGEQQAEQARRQDIFRSMAGLLSGQGTSTQTVSIPQGGFGAGFAQLFGAGLQGLFQGGGNNLQPINPQVLDNARRAFTTPVSQFGNLFPRRR